MVGQLGRPGPAGVGQEPPQRLVEGALGRSHLVDQVEVQQEAPQGGLDGVVEPDQVVDDGLVSGQTSGPGGPIAVADPPVGVALRRLVQPVDPAPRPVALLLGVLVITTDVAREVAALRSVLVERELLIYLRD